MHKPWLYHITGITGYQVVAQRIERHGRSREIRNAHVLARCGVLAVEELRLLLDKPPVVALALLGIILNATAAYAACDEAPSHDRKRNPTFHVREQNPSGCWGFAHRSSLHSRFGRVGSFA